MYSAQNANSSEILCWTVNTSIIISVFFMEYLLLQILALNKMATSDLHTDHIM
jgi:hypothetical protein